MAPFNDERPFGRAEFHPAQIDRIRIVIPGLGAFEGTGIRVRRYKAVGRRGAEVWELELQGVGEVG